MMLQMNSQPVFNNQYDLQQQKKTRMAQNVPIGPEKG